MDTKIQKEKSVSGVQKIFRRTAERFGGVERVQNIGRAFGVGSCAYSDFNPAEILGVASGWFH